ncbi:MAG: winged helix-turn-helix domain-containing protein [Pseudomonadota bacterium]
MQYRFQSYLIDTARFSLTGDGETVELEPQVLRLLVYLLEHRDRVVPREELMQKLFGQRIVTDNALNVRIRAARRAVGDTARQQRVIATVQGAGYRFVANVEAAAGTRAGVTAARWIDEDRGATTAADRSSLAIAAQPSMVVLPFELLAGADEKSAIASGLTHDVITRVACSRAVLVIARGTAFRFSGGKHDVQEIGTELGVRYVCQGAVQIADGRVRISVGLAETTTRQEIWSEQYDRPLIDVLTLQQDIAASIVSELEYEVQRNEMRIAALQPASTLDAWSAYHRGLNHMYRFRTSECDSAEKYFRRALDLEGGLARPYAGLSFVNYERAYLNLSGDRTRMLRLAQDQARRAIELDPLDPMGYWALSRIQFLAQDIEAAQASVAYATDLNPSYATAQYFLGWVSMLLGERETCHDRIELARRLSPQDPLFYGMQGISALNLALMGRTEEALARTRQAIHHPDVHYQAHAVGIVIFALAGEGSLASDELKKTRAVKPDYSLDDFFAANAFQTPGDIQRLADAFRSAERSL